MMHGSYEYETNQPTKQNILAHVRIDCSEFVNDIRLYGPLIVNNSNN